MFKVSIIGYLGRDPEIKTTNDGVLICTLSVATSESWLDRASNTRKERTEWHRIIIFNSRITNFAENYLHKGARVYIEGQLQKLISNIRKEK